MFFPAAIAAMCETPSKRVWQPEELRAMASCRHAQNIVALALESAADTIEYLRSENRKLVKLAYPADPV